MSSIFKILVFIGTVIICFDISSAQDPIWLKNNFHECLQLERDRLVMTAVIKRNSNTTFTARSAVFQISSNGDTIKECMLWGLNNGCERVLNKDCYCESQNDEQVTIVFTPVANLSYIGKNVTVNVPCVYTEDSITSTELNISLSSFDKSPSLTVNNEEVDLSRQFVSSKVPALINFCCSTSSQPHCHAHIKRNNQIIDNRSHCVSFTETSSSYVPYTFFSTHCNQTSEILNFMFLPEDDNTRRTNMLEVLGYCFLMILATVALKDIVIIFISFKCPGILRCFSVYLLCKQMFWI
uniref:Phlebovirus glycoprotein G2 fusion domain-containing protein n=1 Tax=Biomphalaria glabrata TaxID=6526 RepID=A0A2C9KMP7_BIOGL